MELVSRLEDALEAALARYEVEDEKALQRRFGTGPTTHVVVRDGRRYDASLLARLMLEGSSPAHAPQGPDRDSAHSLLAAANVDVVALDKWTVEDELRWRLDAWDVLRSLDRITPRWLRDRAVFGGAQGVWVDKQRTQQLAPEGAAVAVLHTGRHYADDLHGTKVLYHYPHTSRPPARDANEVAAVKNVRGLGLPVFLITELPGGSRQVQLAWVATSDDAAEAFLMECAEVPPDQTDFAPPPEDAPFALAGTRSRRRTVRDVLERDPEFKFRVLRRYASACAISGVAVKEVLDAAHVVPVDKGGTDDERNGLLLTATLHRALDAHLWALEPRTHAIVTRAAGPTLADLRVSAHALRSGAPAPHPDALDWRYKQFRRKTNEPIGDVLEELGLLNA